MAAKEVRDKGTEEETLLALQIGGREMTWAPLEVVEAGWGLSLRWIDHTLSPEDCCGGGSEGHREGVILVDSTCGVQVSLPACPFLLPWVLQSLSTC